MAVTIPLLDNRTYDEIRDELVGRIPVYLPEWTDHNETDPGIALIELFAFLATSLQIRLNLVPDATFRAYLRLLDIPLRPARPATALVATETADAQGVNIPPGSEAKAGPVLFETDREVTVWPLEVLGVAKQQAEPEEPSPTSKKSRARLAREEQTAQILKTSPSPVTKENLRFYEQVTFGIDPLAPGTPTVDISKSTVDGSLWIALLAKKGFDRSAFAKQERRVLCIGVALDDSLDADREPRLGLPGVQRFRCNNNDPDRPAMFWRLWHAEHRHTAETPSWREVSVVDDSTRGLTRSGVVHLSLPTLEGYEPAPRGGNPQAGDSLPPPLDDAELRSRLVGWLQVKRPVDRDESTPIGSVRWVGVNVVEVTQARRTPSRELIGVGNSDAYQQFRLNHADVLAKSVDLIVDENGGSFRWSEVEDFTGTDVDDRHFTVDRASGLVRFGTKKRPLFGERIHVAYRYGGGALGNVGPGAITKLDGATKASNPFPARGGADAETEALAIERIPALLRRRDRAVTASDFADLAAAVPEVGRAEALHTFNPRTPTVPAAGVVTVVVFPRHDIRDERRPMPDAGLLRAVCADLDPRRLLTTELYVIPPTYVPIAVSAAVEVRPGAPVDRVRLDVRRQLERYLAPLPPGGPTGGGWPLGRTVRRAELEAVASRVDGVEYIRELRLAYRDPDRTTWDEEPEIDLDKWEVPGIVSFAVTDAAEAANPAEPLVVPSDLSKDFTKDTVFFPVKREIC